MIYFQIYNNHHKYLRRQLLSIFFFVIILNLIDMKMLSLYVAMQKIKMIQLKQNIKCSKNRKINKIKCVGNCENIYIFYLNSCKKNLKCIHDFINYNYVFFLYCTLNAYLYQEIKVDSLVWNFFKKFISMDYLVLLLFNYFFFSI